MTVFRALIGSLLGVALLATSMARPAAAEPVLHNPKLSGAHEVSLSRPVQLSPDGSRVVYAGGVDDQPRRLFSAPTDGSAAPAAFTAASAFGRVGAFRISPDGSRVVYLYENAPATDELELYSAPLAGGMSVKLNGPLPASVAVKSFSISPDSSRVVYRAGVDGGLEDELFSVPITGGAMLHLNDVPAEGETGSKMVISPDSSRVVYKGADNQLYASRLDAYGSDRLHEQLPASRAVRDFAIASNTYVIYTADQDVNDQAELYRVPLVVPPLVASAQHSATAVGGAIKLNGQLADGTNVYEFQLSPNEQQIVYRADAEQPGQENLYRVALTGGPAEKLNGQLVADGAINLDWTFSPDGQWVIYRADQLVDQVTELFAASLANGDLLRLNPPLVDGGGVGKFALSPDSSRVIYRADQQTVGTSELYSAALPTAAGSPGPPVLADTKLSGQLVANGDVVDFVISPAGDRVVYRADQDTVHVDELYSVALTGGAVFKLNGDLAAGGDAFDFHFTADGSRVVYLSDQEINETTALFAAYEPTPSATITGPAGPLPVGTHAVKVSLSQPMQLANVEIRVDAAGGDAVPGADFLLPGTSTPQLTGSPDVVFVVFAPGEKSKAMPVQVLANAERTAPRTLRLEIRDTAGVNPGNPGSLDLTLAKHDPSVTPPPASPPPSTPPTGYRTMLPLAQR